VLGKIHTQTLANPFTESPHSSSYMKQVLRFLLVYQHVQILPSRRF